MFIYSHLSLLVRTRCLVTVRLMLWSEIGSTPQIERSGMDGSKREVVVSRDLSWPVSLAYDFLDDRVYWADEKLRCIGSTSLDGGNVKVTSTTSALSTGGSP